jgi:EAL domain-containing protein (putative c-di-GMP-specific phosphodiesterase class I)/DNA-binding NarL/FixJ family response regulator
MGHGDLKFLAVEDHEFQRGLLLRMLARLGATQVSTAADGREALEIIKAQGGSIDIIISDLDMPGMDGLEFMRHLGEARVPVAIILASALESALLDSVETMTRAYGVRILGVIQKPITPEKLDALIRLHTAAQAQPNSQGAPGAVFELADIVQGLENDEFEPFFQPKVELAGGRVQGAEALARWRHPQQGIIVPSAFIGALETDEGMRILTSIMLKKSAIFCGKWRAHSGLDVKVSVNLSTRSLSDARFAEWVTQIVRDADLDPQHMILEVTESATMTEIGPPLENLSRLRMKGFGLSIDDYGTGYSSMQRLARAAFTEMKIDRSFVANATAQQSARIILESSLDMARRLNISSVAEGVETQEDWDLLRQLGCDLAQGYFIAKPMPAEEFLSSSMYR